MCDNTGTEHPLWVIEESFPVANAPRNAMLPMVLGVDAPFERYGRNTAALKWGCLAGNRRARARFWGEPRWVVQ